MKKSFYNIFFPYDSKIIGYNCLSDIFICMDENLMKLYDACKDMHDFQNFQKIHIEFYEHLFSNGFLIDDKINELEKIKEISYSTDFDETSYELTINPTMNCNFKCWYCYESHIKNSKMSQKTITAIIYHIKKVVRDKKEIKNFQLNWFGGEPLLYFDDIISPILKQVNPIMDENNIIFSSNFTTNGLLINDILLHACKEYNVTSFQITLDGHRTRHNKVRFINKKRGSYDEIVQNIKKCLKVGITTLVRINISEETLQDLILIVEDFKSISNYEKAYLTFSFHEVWQEEKDLSVDISNLVNSFRTKGLKCIYKGERTASISNSCYADKYNHAVINYNGDIYKCTARDFNPISSEGKLDDYGNIIWNQKFHKRVSGLRFANKPCLTCKILPICNGGCSQIKIENEGRDYCIYGYNHDKKIDLIKEKFYSRLYSIT